MRLIFDSPKEVRLADLSVDPKLAEANPVRSELERKRLLNQIRSEAVDGVCFFRDPLVVWARERELVLVDGMTRHQMAPELGITTCKAYYYEFDSLEEARYWIQINQQSRRNMTELQRCFYIGGIYNDVSGDKNKLATFLRAQGRDSQAEQLLSASSSRINVAEALSIAFASSKNEDLSRFKIIRYGKVHRSLERIKSLNAPLFERLITDQAVSKDGSPIEISVQLLASLPEDVEKIKSETDLLKLYKAAKVESPASSPGQQSKEQDGVREMNKMFKEFIADPDAEKLEALSARLEKYLRAHKRVLKTA